MWTELASVDLQFGSLYLRLLVCSIQFRSIYCCLSITKESKFCDPCNPKYVVIT